MPSLLKKTINGLILVAIFNFIRFSGNFLIQLLLIRLLSPVIFGNYAFSTIFVQCFILMSSLQTKKLVIQDKNNPKKVLETGLFLEIIFSILLFIILLIGVKPLLQILNKENLILYVQVLSFSLLLNPFLVISSYYEKKIAFKPIVYLELIRLFFTSISSLILVLLGFEIWALIIAFLIGKAVFVLLLLLITKNLFRPKLHRSCLPLFFKQGLPLMFAGMVMFWYWNFDDFLVGQLLSLTALGYYWFAFRIPHFILSFIDKLSEVVYAAYSNTIDDAQLIKGFNLSTKWSAIILLYLLLISLFFGRDLILFIFGNQWEPAIVPFQIFMILITVRGGITRHWADILILKGKSYPILITTLINATGISVLGYILTKYFGLIGMSFAVLITILMVVPYCIFTLKSVLKNISYIKLLYKEVSLFLILLFILKFAVSIFHHYYFILLIPVSIIYISAIYFLNKTTIKDIIKKYYVIH